MAVKWRRAIGLFLPCRGAHISDMYRLLAAALVLVLWPVTAFGEIIGTASVTDGDTIKIHGERIRLHGIDAPESGQMCIAQGREYRCGQKAALALAGEIGRKPVTNEDQATNEMVTIFDSIGNRVTDRQERKSPDLIGHISGRGR